MDGVLSTGDGDDAGAVSAAKRTSSGPARAYFQVYDRCVLCYFAHADGVSQPAEERITQAGTERPGGKTTQAA